MRLFRPPWISRFLYPDALFRIDSRAKDICITFDDGPDPSSTLQILDVLSEKNVKAVFFCSGMRAVVYPHLVQALISKGHIIGNHGFDHPDGWKVSCDDYIKNVSRADNSTSGMLFRPPYGHMTYCQYKALKSKYKIVLWDLMPYDFDKSLRPDDCLHILKKKLLPGSIIVLHDTMSSHALYFLKDFIDYAINEGYKFVVPESIS